MKKKIALTAFVFLLVLFTFGQRPILNLKFTAKNNSTYVQLNSIKIVQGASYSYMQSSLDYIESEV